MIAAALLLALPFVFDGSSWLDAAPCSDLGGDLTYSVRAVVSVPVGTPESSTGRSVYAAASTSSSTAYFSLGLPDGSRVASATHRTGSTFYSARGSASIVDGARHVLCAVADGSTLVLYVDGALAGSASLAGAAPASRGLCTYGALRRFSSTAPGYVVSSYFVGEVTSVATWDRARDAAEVGAFCSVAPQPPEPEDLACPGHAGLTWDEYADPTVGWFEVERAVAGSGAWSVVGDTRYKNRDAYEERPAVRAGSWDVLRAVPVPAEGVSYDYRVRAVRESDGARSGPSNVYACPPQDPTLCLPGGTCP